MRRTAPTRLRRHFTALFLPLLLVGCLYLLPALSPADDFLARLDYREFLDRFDSAMEESPPDFADVVPGIGVSGLRPRLLIADFSTTTPEPAPLALALADVLRHDLSLLAAGKFVFPAYVDWPLDVRAARGRFRDPLPDTETRQRLVRMWNADRIVEGEWRRQGENFHWRVTIRKTDGEGAVHDREWRGKLAGLPTALNEALQWLSNTLGIPASDSPAGTITGYIDTALLERLGRFLIASEQRYDQFRREHAIEAWESGLSLPATGRALLNSLDFHEVTEETLGWAKTIGDSLPHPEIRALALRLQAVYGPSAERSARIQQMRELLEQDPGNPGLLFELARAFADGGRELTGIGVSLELLHQQPAMARSWDSMAHSLIRYGWTMRGQNYWRRVPERARRRFLAALRLARYSAEQCLARAPGHPACLVDRMQTLNGYSDELIALLEEAISVDPHYLPAYVSALNFTMPVWNGSIEKQRYVLDLASQNIPDSERIEVERAHLAPDVPGPWHRHLFLIVVVLFAAAIVVGLLYLHYRARTD